MRVLRIVGPGLLLATALGLVGCQKAEKALDVDLHKPGQYMGKHDPLLDKSANPQFQRRLAARLERVQTDR